MKITFELPEIKYPYLAIYEGIGAKEIPSHIDKDEIVVISKMEQKKGDSEIYVSSLFGNKEGHYTAHEEEYMKLPTGFTVTIEQ